MNVILHKYITDFLNESRSFFKLICLDYWLELAFFLMFVKEVSASMEIGISIASGLLFSLVDLGGLTVDAFGSLESVLSYLEHPAFVMESFGL